MPYNTKNKLLRAAEMQDITVAEIRKGHSYSWVYRNIIRPRFRISRATYYNYLREPAKLMLKKYSK